jgi:hypothetical protein
MPVRSPCHAARRWPLAHWHPVTVQNDATGRLRRPLQACQAHALRPALSLAEDGSDRGSDYTSPALVVQCRGQADLPHPRFRIDRVVSYFEAVPWTIGRRIGLRVGEQHSAAAAALRASTTHNASQRQSGAGRRVGSRRAKPAVRKVHTSVPMPVRAMAVDD